MSDEFFSNPLSKLVPPLEEALKEQICNEMHDAFQIELSEKQAQLGKAIEVISLLQRKLENTEELIDRQEQYSRRYCLRIYGLRESLEKATNELILNLASDKLKIDLDDSHIDRSHRVFPRQTATARTPNESKPMPIIVKFTTYKAREKFYRARTLLKGTGIYINEDLSPRNQLLFAKARNHQKVKKSWTLYGKLYIIDGSDQRKRINSSSEKLV